MKNYTEDEVLKIIGSVLSKSNLLAYQNLMGNLSQPKFNSEKYIEKFRCADTERLIDKLKNQNNNE